MVIAPQYTATAILEYLKVRKWDILQWSSQPLDLNLNCLKEHLEQGNTMFGDAHAFQTSIQVLKTIFTFKITLVYLITFDLVKMGCYICKIS